MNEDNLQTRRKIQEAHRLAKINFASNLERICYEIGASRAFAVTATKKGRDEPCTQNESQMTSEEILFALRHLMEKGTLTMSQVQMVLQELLQPTIRPEVDGSVVQAKAAEIVETAKRVAGELEPPRI